MRWVRCKVSRPNCYRLSARGYVITMALILVRNAWTEALVKAVSLARFTAKCLKITLSLALDNLRRRRSLH
jgi:hypothetical protein